MHYQPIGRSDSVPVGTLALPNDNATSPPAPLGRLWPILIVCGLPFLALYLLVRFVCRDVLAVGRGMRIFHAAVAEDLSRKH